MISSCLFRNAICVIMPMTTLSIRRNLEMEFMILHQWFHENHMSLNPGKCHYMVIDSRDLSHDIIMRKNY